MVPSEGIARPTSSYRTSAVLGSCTFVKARRKGFRPWSSKSGAHGAGIDGPHPRRLVGGRTHSADVKLVIGGRRQSCDGKRRGGCRYRCSGGRSESYRTVLNFKRGAGRGPRERNRIGGLCRRCKSRGSSARWGLLYLEIVDGNVHGVCGARIPGAHPTENDRIACKRSGKSYNCLLPRGNPGGLHLAGLGPHGGIRSSVADLKLQLVDQASVHVVPKRHLGGSQRGCGNGG